MCSGGKGTGGGRARRAGVEEGEPARRGWDRSCERGEEGVGGRREKSPTPPLPRLEGSWSRQWVLALAVGAQFCGIFFLSLMEVSMRANHLVNCGSGLAPNMERMRAT